LYCQQMSEPLFHNDETRWEVFVELEGKVGTRWYLWVTRSPSVIFILYRSQSQCRRTRRAFCRLTK
jgi:transposase